MLVGSTHQRKRKLDRWSAATAESLSNGAAWNAATFEGASLPSVLRFHPTRGSASAGVEESSGSWRARPTARCGTPPPFERVSLPLVRGLHPTLGSVSSALFSGPRCGAGGALRLRFRGAGRAQIGMGNCRWPPQPTASPASRRRACASGRWVEPPHGREGSRGRACARSMSRRWTRRPTAGEQPRAALALPGVRWSPRPSGRETKTERTSVLRRAVGSRQSAR